MFKQILLILVAIGVTTGALAQDAPIGLDGARHLLGRIGRGAVQRCVRWCSE